MKAELNQTQLNYTNLEARVEETETRLEGQADSLAENFTRVSTVLADFDQFQDRFAQRGADVAEQDKELALLKVANEELRVSHAKQQETIEAQAARIKEQDEKLATMEEKMAKITGWFDQLRRFNL